MGAKLRHHVHFPDRPEWADAFAAACPVPVTFGGDPPPQTTIWVEGRPDAARLDALTELCAIVVPYAGIPGATAKLLRDRPGIKLFNLHHNGADTAEMALALLFALARRLPALDAGLRKGDWEGRYQSADAVRLDGKTAVVLGMGAIGTRVFRVLEAVGMRVIGVRRSGGTTLDEALPQGQIVMVTLPLTPETEGLLDARRLALLPPGALVVNVGRGPVIDEEAFYRALESGQIGGAGLDVWWRYPGRDDDRRAHSPSRFDFSALPNVVMAPHVGGATDASEAHRREAVLTCVVRIVEGDLSAAADPARGY